MGGCKSKTEEPVKLEFHRICSTNDCNLLKVNNAYLGPCCWFDDDDRECRRLRHAGRRMDDRSACSVGKYICCCYLDE